MGGAAMKEMREQMEIRRSLGNWVDYNVHQSGDPTLCPLPVSWSVNEKGSKSSIVIGLPRIARSVQPKQKKRWSPHTPVTCISPNKIQIGDIPIMLEWKTKEMDNNDAENMVEDMEREIMEEDERQEVSGRGRRVEFTTKQLCKNR